MAAVTEAVVRREPCCRVMPIEGLSEIRGLEFSNFDINMHLLNSDNLFSSFVNLSLRNINIPLPSLGLCLFHSTIDIRNVFKEVAFCAFFLCWLKAKLPIEMVLWPISSGETRLTSPNIVNKFINNQSKLDNSILDPSL